MIHLEFRLINKEISSNIYEKALYIEGIANSGCEDLVGDTVTLQALQQICAEATNHNLHLDHDTDFDGLIGTITESEIVDEGVRIRARILDERRNEIESLLNQGVKLGLSVAGLTTCNENNPSMIDEWILTEISLTPVPCDQRTMGTVHIAKSIKQLIDETAGNTDKQEDTEETDISVTIDVKSNIDLHNNKSSETIPEEEEGDDDEDTTVENDSTEESCEEDETNKGDENMAEETMITEEQVIELINTAFADNQETFLEIIRKEIKDEYEAKFNAQEERIAAIEAQLEAIKNPETEPEEEETGTEEEKAEDEEEEVIIEVPEEEEEKDIEKTVINVISKLLGTNEEPEDPSFQYDNKGHDTETTNKKGFTPRELAEMMAKQ